MSTQSIFHNDVIDVKESLDEVFSCSSNKLILVDKLGFKFSMTSTDTFLLNYLYDLVNNENNCFLLASNECSLEKVNKLLFKYK